MNWTWLELLEFKLTLSFLPIYHLTKDKFSDVNGLEQEIEGSDGLTLNTNAYLYFEINNRSELQFNLAMPLVVRDERPDGLTRSLIATLEYHIKL